MLNHQETYKIVARHFAETIKVHLVFEEGATPATDGKTIILPPEMRYDLVDVTLGALLHETGHIRMTDFSCMERLTENQKICYNVLEDIRIDEATYTKYPNARGFQEALIEEVIKNPTNKAKILKEPFVIQILKGLLFKANNYDPTTIYSKDVCEAIQKLQPFIDKSKHASQMEIESLAKDLCRLLLDEGVQQAKRQQSTSGAGTGSGEGGAGEQQESQQGSDKSTSGQGQGNATPKSGAIDIDKYDELSTKCQEAGQTIQKNKEDIVEQAQKYNDHVDKYKDLKRRYKLNDTKLRKNKADYNEKNSQNGFGSTQEKQEQEEKIKAKEQEVNDLKDKFEKQTRDTKQLHDQINQLKNDIYGAKNDKDEFQQAIEQMAGAMFTQIPDDQVELLGFKALRDMDFAVPHDEVDELDTCRSLDDLIREVLVLKHERSVEDEDGSKLNGSRLADVFTDYEKVFCEEHRKEKKTHVAFIIDASGSMDADYYNGSQKTSKELALGALKTLCSALKRAIMVGAPAEFSIHAFGNHVIPICESSEDYNEQSVVAKYETARHVTGGGTNLSQAVTMVNEFMAEKEGDDRIAIILTDAEVDDYQIEVLQKEAMTDQAKFMFVGLNVKEGTAASWNLFGDFNITSPDEAVEILQRSLMTLM